jgi:hypothetical protein
MHNHVATAWIENTNAAVIGKKAILRMISPRCENGIEYIWAIPIVFRTVLLNDDFSVHYRSVDMQGVVTG